jgi:hypothetical protein
VPAGAILRFARIERRQAMPQVALELVVIRRPV